MSRELFAVAAVLLATQAAALWIAGSGPGVPAALWLARRAVLAGYAPHGVGAALGLLALLALVGWRASRARRAAPRRGES